MLNALYEYAQRKELTPPAGCIGKTVKAYISLLGDGRFTGIVLGDAQEVFAPDIGSLANGTDKSNVLIEKRSVIIPLEQSKKSQFFLEALIAASEEEPRMKPCARALEDEAVSAQIRAELDANKIKDSDRVTFMVDGEPIVKMPAAIRWWQSYRKRFSTAEREPAALCLITGEPTIPILTTSKIKGLQAVGGHSSGDALICFDKPAFQSYGLQKAENAPVSEEAFSSVGVALKSLLEGAPILAGTKFVHWFDCEIPPEEDLITHMVLGAFAQLNEDDEDDEDDEETPSDIDQKERDARGAADKWITSIHTGKQPPLSMNTNYYILMLSGVSGRVMIRRYERGNYAQLRERIDRWYDDLRLVNASGTGMIKPCKMRLRLTRLVGYQKDIRGSFERMDKELSNLAPAILHAILNGGPLPDAVAARAIAYIRSSLLDDANANGRDQVMLDSLACQWLKVWLIRHNTERSHEYMDQYNFDHTDAVKHCGGLVAVYAAIQKKAMPEVNVGVTERFFASALQAPALVMGRLAHMSVHHLSKLEPWFFDYYTGLLEDLSTSIKDIPGTLNLSQQSSFALGYYQMGAHMKKERNERIAASKLRKEANANNTDGGENNGN